VNVEALREAVKLREGEADRMHTWLRAFRFPLVAATCFHAGMGIRSCAEHGTALGDSLSWAAFWTLLATCFAALYVFRKWWRALEAWQAARDRLDVATGDDRVRVGRR
jgi:hypothetical protein